MRKYSLGARQLLTFLQAKSTRDGYCYWKQSTIAEAFGKDIRTIRRWISELADDEHGSPKILSVRHGHFNYYITDEIQIQMSYREKSTDNLEKCVEIERKTKDGVLSDRTFLSYREGSHLLTEILRLEIQTQNSSGRVSQAASPVFFNPSERTPEHTSGPGSVSRKPPDRVDKSLSAAMGSGP